MMENYEKFEFFVFDWDGTICDTISSIIKAYQYAAEQMGFEVPSNYLVRSTIGMSTQRCLSICCPECPAHKYEEYFKHYTSYYIPHEAQNSLVPGIEELLRDMQKLNLRMGIATGKSRRGMNRVLTKFNLTGLFESVQTSDVNFSKPNPQMLENISEESGVECSKMLMIGDSSLDLLMADNAGAAGLGVSYGATPLEELEKAPHLKLCSSVDEIREFLEI